jgi:hypothetical protein
MVSETLLSPAKFWIGLFLEKFTNFLRKPPTEINLQTEAECSNPRWTPLLSS